MLSPRIRSIVTPEGQSVQLEAPESRQPVRDFALQTQVENIQRSRQFAQQSNQDISTIINQMGSDIQQQRQAEAITRSSESIREGSGNTLAAFANLANTAIEVYGAVQEDRMRKQQLADEQRQAENEQQLLENLTYINRDKEQLLSQAHTMLRDPSVGAAGYHDMVSRFLQQNRPYMDNEEFIGLTSELYAPMREIMEEEAEAYFGSFSQIFNEQANTATTTMRIQFAGQLAQIARATNPQQAQDLANTFTTELMGLVHSGNYSPLQVQQITSALLTDLETQYGISTEAQAEVQLTLSNLQNYIQAYQENVYPLQQNGQYAEADQLDMQLRLQYGITGDTRFTDPLLNEAENLRRIQLQRTGREEYEAGLLDARRFQQFERAEVLTLALQFFDDPSQQALWENTPGWEENPYIAQAIELANQVREWEEFSSGELPIRRNAIQQDIARINTQIAQLTRSYIEGSSSDVTELQNTLLFLNSMQNSAANFFSGEGRGEEFSRIQADQQATMQALIQQFQGGRASPEQVRDAVQDVIDSLQVSQRLLQEEYSILENSRPDIARVLNQWGLSSIEDFRVQAAASQETYQNIVNEILEIERNVQQNFSPAQPNFNLPQLDTYTYNSVEAIVPFRIGAVPNIQSTHDPNSGQRFGDDRVTHTHAGVDFSVPVGTEIVSYIDGVVERVWNDPDGYGKYVVIVSNQDGTRHLFAHMSDIPLQEGQRVAPGDLIGLSGNTGRGTGPHLHWQIMRAGTSAFTYDVSINPFEYTAGLRQNVRPRQPTAAQPTTTNGGRVRLVNGYAPIDLNSYRSGNGFGNDGEANHGYAPLAQNRDLRVRLHQVSAELNIPSQWLADVIAYETGGSFSSNVWNYGGAPAVGLIQFYEDYEGAGYKTIRGRRYSLQEISRMNNVEQMNLVRDYLIEMMPSGGYQSAYELLMTIWGGSGGLAQLRRNPQEAARRTDGDITFLGYTQGLGRHAGRRYTPLLGAPPIHTRLVSGCPLCSQMTVDNFVQHEAQ